MSGQKRRVDIATDAVVQSYIADRSQGRADGADRGGAAAASRWCFRWGSEAVETPLPTELEGFDPKSAPMRIGASQAAGGPARSIAMWARGGRKGVVCATGDGIVLQLTPDGRPTPLFEVESLDWAPQDPRWFAIAA